MPTTEPTPNPDPAAMPRPIGAPWLHAMVTDHDYRTIVARRATFALISAASAAPLVDGTKAAVGARWRTDVRAMDADDRPIPERRVHVVHLFPFRCEVIGVHAPTSHATACPVLEVQVFHADRPVGYCYPRLQLRSMRWTADHDWLSFSLASLLDGATGAAYSVANSALEDEANRAVHHEVNAISLAARALNPNAEPGFLHRLLLGDWKGTPEEWDALYALDRVRWEASR